MSACFSAIVHAAEYLVAAEGECCYTLPAHVAGKPGCSKTWRSISALDGVCEVGWLRILEFLLCVGIK